MDTELKAILQFFDHLGLAYQLTSVRSDSFMQGMDIKNGVLLIDRKSLIHVGDLLHEAGHIAVTEEAVRHKLQGDVSRSGHQAGEEMAAIAWSWAALKHIGLRPELVFHEDGYKQGSKSIIDAFKSNNGFGIPLLVYWQMCLSLQNNSAGFPKMQNWLRLAENA
ncbi:hypothetical protein AB4238_02540 [Shewanella sp. 10N.286.45.A1]|uniref:hypothetical protein n=1 Tax=Shewanella sp. 10N.286.45.A1 TaxID=3229694 RepID=UPI00355450C1